MTRSSADHTLKYLDPSGDPPEDGGPRVGELPGRLPTDSVPAPTEAGCPMENQGRPDILELSDGGVIDNTVSTQPWR